MPNNPAKRLQWLNIMQLPFVDPDSIKICEQHFNKSHIGRKKLKFNAIPVLDLEQAKEDCSDTGSVWSLKLPVKYTYADRTKKKEMSASNVAHYVEELNSEDF